LEAVFILLEFRSPSRRIFIGSHSLPPLWFAVSVLQPRRRASAPATSASGPRPCLPEVHAFPRPARASKRLEARARPPPLPTGRTAQDPAVLAVLPCASARIDVAAVSRVKAGVLHPAARPHLLLVKTQPTRTPFRSTLPRTEPPAGAIDGSRGELQVRPATHRTKLFPTFPCTQPNPPACPFSLQNPTSPAQEAAAATALGRQRPTSPTLPPPQLSPGMEP
jgi:hypothetical protein